MPFLLREPDVDVVSDQVEDFSFENTPHLVVPLPWAIEHDTRYASGALHLGSRDCRGHKRGSTHHHGKRPPGSSGHPYLLCTVACQSAAQSAADVDNVAQALARVSVSPGPRRVRGASTVMVVFQAVVRDREARDARGQRRRQMEPEAAPEIRNALGSVGWQDRRKIPPRYRAKRRLESPLRPTPQGPAIGPTIVAAPRLGLQPSTTPQRR